MFDSKSLQNILGTVQEQLKDIEEQSKKIIIDTNSGGDLVKVKFNGAGELIDIKIDDEIMKDKQTLQVLLISALNDGYRRVEELKKQNILGNGNVTMFH